MFDSHPGLTQEDLLGQSRAFLYREEGRLLGVDQNRHDDLIEDRQGAFDKIYVPVGDRIERTWIDGCTGCHGTSFKGENGG